MKQHISPILYKSFLLIVFVFAVHTNVFAQACNTPWVAGTTYTVGAAVSYNNRNYTNRYGNDGGQPDINAQPSWGNWIDAGACASCNSVNPGSIGSAQSILTNTTPSALTNISGASGGNGSSYTYQWQVSTNNSTWADISGANATTYSPGVLTTNTYYRRRANSCTEVGFTSSILISIILPIDTDGDGVLNHIDLDDDNDGIVDTQECPTNNFAWSGIPTLSGNTATGSIGNANYTYTSSVPVATTANIFNHGVFPASYGIPNTTSIQNTFVSSNTLAFDRVIKDPVLVFASIGSSGLIVPITFGSPIEVLFSTAVTQISNTEIRGEEGFAIVRLNGTFSQISFNYLVNEGYVNFYFGVDFTNNCDTDGDGIFNTLDLDSDGDGCPDAIEGAAAFTPVNLTSDRLSGTVDANGVPTIAGASGQTIGSSTNSSIRDLTCPACPDNDSDGICDINDIDDDNDGILDVAECPAGNFQWSSTPQVVSTNVASGTIHGFVNYTYTSDQPVQTEGVFQGAGSFPVQYNLVDGVSIMNTQVSSNTIVFSQPVTDPILAFGSIGAGGFPVGITFSNPIQILWSQDVVQNSSTQITGSEGHAIIKLNGVFTSFSFNYLVSEFRVNFAFGSDFTNDCDIDNDGIANSLDLDSDGDGCPDAIEGGAAFTTANLTGSTLSGSVNAQGVPVIATASGQAVGISQNVTIIDPSCVTVCSTDNDLDGICDNVDLDDDNDGILDTNECPATLTNLVQNGNFESGNTGFTSDYSYTSSMSAPNQFFIGSQGVNLYAPCTDHTSGTASGQMIIADGSTTAGTRIFCQNINVTQNTNYQVGFWAANAGNPVNNPAQLRATINGVTLGSSITVPSTTCNWVNFTQTYNSGTNTSVQFCIIDDNVIFSGNNFLLDDISFTLPSLCDTDNDGVINSLDTDSDGDGCPDAIEGGAAFTTANLTGSSLSGSVNAQGVPVIATASGQAVGISQNVTIIDPSCVTACTSPTISSALTGARCSGTLFNYTITSATTGATFAWSRAAVTGISNAAGSGTGASISETLINTTSAPVTVTYVLTPTGPAPTSCPGTASNLVVTVNPRPTISNATLTANLCSGTALSYTMTSATTGATFAWTRANVTNIAPAAGSGSTASIAETLTNSTAAAINVTYVMTPSANGCTGTASNLVVSVFPPLSITTQPTATQTVCEGASVSLSVVASGPAALNYQWRQGATNVGTNAATLNLTSITTAQAGTYSVVVTSNAAGYPSPCNSITSGNAIVSVNSAPAQPSSISGATSVCPGNQTYSVTNVASVTYQWTVSAGGAFSPVSTTNATTINWTLAGGPYAVSVVARDPSGICPNSAPRVRNVTVNSGAGATVAAPTGTARFCASSSAITHQYTVPVQAGIAYAWTIAPSAGVTLSPGVAPGDNVVDITWSTSATTGAYTLTCTPSNGCGAGTDSTLNIIMDTIPVITAITAQTVCSEIPTAVVTLEANVPSSFSWSSSVTSGSANGNTATGTGNIPAQTITNAGTTQATVTYVVSATSNAPTSCASTTTQNFVVKIDAKPSTPVFVTPTISPLSICTATQDLEVTASLGTVHWTVSGSGATVSPATGLKAIATIDTRATAFTFTAKVKNGSCPDDSATTVITRVNDLTIPVVSSPDTPNVCYGNGTNTITLEGNAVASGETGTWTGTPSPTQVGTNATALLTLAASYTYTYTVSNGVCPDSAKTITVTMLPDFATSAATGDEVCLGDIGTITLASAQSGVTYRVMNAGVPVTGSPIVSDFGPTFTLSAADLPAGDNFFDIYAADAGLVCSKLISSNIEIQVLAAPAAIAGASDTCENNANGLNYSIPAVTGADSYIWTISPSSSGTITSGQGSNSIFANLNANASITVTPETTTGFSCEDSSIVVTIIPAYTGGETLTADNLLVCEGGSVNVSVVGATTGATYTNWSGPPGFTQISTSNSQVAFLTFDKVGGVVTVQPVHPCQANIPALSIVIEVRTIPVANAGSDQVLDQVSSTILDGSLSSQGTGLVYTWTSDNSSLIDSQFALITSIIPESFSNVYNLNVAYAGLPDCAANDQVVVAVNSTVHVPNAFSPNGDGNHDVLVLKNIEYFPNAILEIYNQWGELIYISDRGYSKAWDGTVNGKEVSISAYYYVLNLNNGAEAQAGHINLLR